MRQSIEQHMGLFEGNWQPEFTPKERLYLEKRGMVQSDLKDTIRKEVEKEVEWHL